ncbi:MAG: ribosomal protein L14 [uncultured bacterium]|nr:MAG: ribosomal protein L14 [uncultured bacterium]
MIQQYSRLNVADNSGAKIVQCILVFGGRKKDQGELGDIIVASVKKALPNSNAKKKEVVKAVIVRQRAPFQRFDGSKIRFDDNAVVLINPEGLPRGTRVMGPVAREVRDRGYSKVASLAQELL